ncbi:porin [Psychromonas ossibalaenae]|uniref:porin n=1 Tax=Psychromonas ossibalaenae TaxID=444922 RepID=UPI0003802A4F|nr:porin [Psychromonas ossibalaenae]
MKKTLLALVIPAMFASSANAYDFYQTDDLKLSVKGQMEIQYIQKLTPSSSEKGPEMRFDDGEVEFKVKANLGNDVSAISSLRTEFKSNDVEDGGTIKLDRYYVGLEYGGSQLIFGRMKTFGDWYGTNDDQELGQWFWNTPTKGDDVIRYMYYGENFWFGVDADLQEKTSDGSTDTSLVETIANVDIGPVTLQGFYSIGEYPTLVEADQNTQAKSTSGGAEWKTFWGHAVYNYKDLSFAGGYGEEEYDDVVTEMIQATITYKMGDMRTMVGYSQLDTDGQKASDNYFANVIYKFHPNMKAYVEVANQTDMDFAYLAGMEVSF